MKKNIFKKLTTAVVAVIIAAMMATPAFAETRLCGEVPTWEDDSQYPELEPSIEASPEYGVIANENGEEAVFPADPAFYESGEDDDFRDMGEEMDAAAESIGLPTREEIAQNSSEVWEIEPGEEEASLYGECYHSEETHIQPVEVGDDPTPVREEENKKIYQIYGDNPPYTW